jgi:hypothetical protein
VIGRLTPKATPANTSPILPFEIRATVRLYAAGKIDQWYIKPDETAEVPLANRRSQPVAVDAFISAARARVSTHSW